MTVIAASLREMAADTLVQLDGYPDCHMTKIFRLEDGSIIGGAGSSPNLEEMIAWLMGGEIPGNAPGPLLKEGAEYTILRLKPDGIWLYADCIHPYKLHEKVFAIGCGAHVALHAMQRHKMTPAQAAAESCTVTAGCGGPIEVLKLPQPRKRRGK